MTTPRKRKTSVPVKTAAPAADPYSWFSSLTPAAPAPLFPEFASSLNEWTTPPSIASMASDPSYTPLPEGEIAIPMPEATYSIPGFGDRLKGWWDGVKDSAFDQRDAATGLLNKQGWFMPSLYGIQAIGGLVDAHRQYKLGKQSLNFQKEAFRTNLENQRKLINAELERKAQARLSAGTTTESVADYMKRYGV